MFKLFQESRILNLILMMWLNHTNKLMKSQSLGCAGVRPSGHCARGDKGMLRAVPAVRQACWSPSDGRALALCMCMVCGHPQAWWQVYRVRVCSTSGSLACRGPVGPRSAGRGAAVGPAPCDGDRRGMEGRRPRRASARGVSALPVQVLLPTVPFVTLLWRYLSSSVVKVTKVCCFDRTVCLLRRLLFPGRGPGTSFHPTGSAVSVTALKGHCHVSLWKVCWKSRWCWRLP